MLRAILPTAISPAAPQRRAAPRRHGRARPNTALTRVGFLLLASGLDAAVILAIAAASGAALRPPPQITHRVAIVSPSDSTTWSSAISLTLVPSRISTPRSVSTLEA